VVVSDVPGRRHADQVYGLRQQLAVYSLANPGQVHRVYGAGECKLVVPALESERHPDLAVYKKPPRSEKSDVWAEWIPDIVVEVISRGSELRDHDEKREEYLNIGVREYWVLDHFKQEMLALRRVKGRWSERHVRPGEGYRTRLLPGFELDLAGVFAAAGGAQE
jgi:Uma2 family endonuclease